MSWHKFPGSSQNCFLCTWKCVYLHVLNVMHGHTLTEYIQNSSAYAAVTNGSSLLWILALLSLTEASIIHPCYLLSHLFFLIVDPLLLLNKRDRAVPVREICWAWLWLSLEHQWIQVWPSLQPGSILSHSPTFELNIQKIKFNWQYFTK